MPASAPCRHRLGRARSAPHSGIAASDTGEESLRHRPSSRVRTGKSRRAGRSVSRSWGCSGRSSRSPGHWRQATFWFCPPVPGSRTQRPEPAEPVPQFLGVPEPVGTTGTGLVVIVASQCEAIGQLSDLAALQQIGPDPQPFGLLDACPSNRRAGGAWPLLSVICKPQILCAACRPWSPAGRVPLASRRWSAAP